MAKGKRRSHNSRRKRTPSKRKSRASGGAVRIKGHSRSPRGPSVDPKTGKRKPTVRVGGHRRRPPSK
jgi:hypothetical protein